MEKVLTTINYSAGDIVSVDLPKDDILDFIVLRLKGVLTISGGASSGTVVDLAPISLIKKIELKLNGQNTIKTFTGGQRWLKDKYYESLSSGKELAGITSGDAAAYSFFAEIKIPLALIRGVNRNAFLLNAPNLSSLQLALTWGTTADLISGGDRTLALTVTKVDVSVRTSNEVGVFGISNEGYLRKDITAANTKFEIRDLPKGAPLKSLMLICYDNSLRNNALINNVKVFYQGSKVLLDLPFNVIRNKNAADFNIPYANLETGVAIIDFDIDGVLKELIDTSLGEVHLELDVNAPTGTAYCQVISETLIPIAVRG